MENQFNLFAEINRENRRAIKSFIILDEELISEIEAMLTMESNELNDYLLEAGYISLEE